MLMNMFPNGLKTTTKIESAVWHKRGGLQPHLLSHIEHVWRHACCGRNGNTWVKDSLVSKPKAIRTLERSPLSCETLEAGSLKVTTHHGSK